MQATTINVSKLSSQAITILEKRYLLKDKQGQLIETPTDMFHRVAKAVSIAERKYGANESEVHDWENIFFEMMANLDFLPNSPTLMNAGTTKGTLSACYVLPLEDNMQSIMQAAYDQAMIEKFGGGVGFPLTNLRPKGISIGTTQGKACGPIAVLKTLSQVGQMITQGGKRDGAHMAVMEVYAADIEDFIVCKQIEGQIHNFNISVGLDRNFMRAIEYFGYVHLTWPICRRIHYKDTTGSLVFDPQSQPKMGIPFECDLTTGRFVEARSLFEKIVDGAWRNGEPGIIFLDRVNEDNVTPKFGNIQASNPCAEQPLLPNESCNLGSINCGQFVAMNANGQPFFDCHRFATVIKDAIRFLDNTIDINNHPTPATDMMNQQTRKIGLGIMGWADTLVRLNIPYDSDKAIELAETIGELLRDIADKTSIKLGAQRGSFPAFEESTLTTKYGTMRNAWRLSIAPTGTISMIANCSSGIEPLFALRYKKHNMSAALADTNLYYVNDDLRKRLDGRYSSEIDLHTVMTDEEKKIFVTASDISPIDHVKMQAVWQKFIDSGISKTINLPNAATKIDVWNVYQQAWELGCKGITVYRAGSREKEVLVDTSIVVSQKRTTKRPNRMTGATDKIQTGHGTLYVTVNFGDDALPFEVFSTLGKAGQCEPAYLEAISRLISLALQSNISIDEIIHQLKGITCCPTWANGIQIKSLADGVANVLQTHRSGQEKKMSSESSLCKECGAGLYSQEGCLTCSECGWSKC